MFEPSREVSCRPPERFNNKKKPPKAVLQVLTDGPDQSECPMVAWIGQRTPGELLRAIQHAKGGIRGNTLSIYWPILSPDTPRYELVRGPGHVPVPVPNPDVVWMEVVFSTPAKYREWLKGKAEVDTPKNGRRFTEADRELFDSAWSPSGQIEWKQGGIRDPLQSFRSNSE